MRARVVVAVLFALVVTACGSSGPAEPELVAIDGVQLLGADVERDESPDATEAEVKATAEASTAFALDVYRAVAAGQPDANLILSPYSLYRLLAMIDVGAAGTTEEEIRRVLRTDLPPERLAEAMNRLAWELSSRQNDKVTFRSADAAWVAPGLEVGRPFVEVLAREFGAPLAQLDFADAGAATAKINEWADKNTGGLIPKAVPDGRIGPSTQLVLADAVYLDARWEDPFDPKDTDWGAFTTAGGGVVPARMMLDDRASGVQNDEYQVVRLPYAGEELSMVAVQPQTVPLRDFVASLSPERLGEIFGAIGDGAVRLYFPRFKARSQLSLNGTLSDLGMPTAFSPGADFSKIAPALSLDFVEQSSYVEVDEKGTKAAAVSSGGFTVSAPGPTVRFDRPFLYLVLDDATGTILFMGQVTDPTAGR